MAQPADLQSILAALAASGSTPTPAQGSHPQPPPPPHGMPQAYPGMPGPPPSAPPGGMPGYPLPQPSSSGSFNLNDFKPSASGNINLHDIKPSASGSIDFQEMLNKAQGRASAMGVPYQNPQRQDSRMGGRRSRSRSRSPRRDYDYNNPYRDERRDTRRSNGFGRDRSRSRSPARRDTYSPAGSGRNHRTRSPLRDDQEVIVVDASVVGLIIGRGGDNLKRIEKMSNTKIQFITGPESGAVRRQCRVEGPQRNRQDAIREIYRVIDENERSKGGFGGGRGGGTPQLAQAPSQSYNTQANSQDNQPALREGELSKQMMVPDKTVGLIIGRGGETIRDLQERSGCHINIVGENKSIGGLRPVNLIGTVEAAAVAQKLILEIVASDERPDGGQQNRNTGGRQQQDQYGGGGGGGQDGKINKSIYVPSDAVGMIIGKGGETIKEMQNSTGCKINVSQPSGPDYQREIGLIGTPHAIQAAERAIDEKVRAVQEKSGGGGRGGGSGGGGGRRDDNYGDRYSQQQQPAGQMPMGGAPQAGAPPAGGDPNDPYAAYGGYANYVAWYYASLMQQQQDGTGGAARPPGA